MGKYFGTDGFRGEANKDLTVEHAFKIGRFLGWYYGKEHPARVIIGKDTRRSSYMFEQALVAGLTASGADAYMLHVTTTPSVSYITRIDGFDCGIMISASHNPYYDNGIKLINGRGEKMEDEVLDEAEKFLDGEPAQLPYACREKIGRAVQADHARLADWALPASADCVVFNFGYLPGADHRLFTRPASSLPALEAALEILRSGGVLSACLYSGGVNGDEEKKAVTAYLEALPPERYTVLICRFANRPDTAPLPCFVLKH